jgi:pectinesterase inhibitor-like protein
MSVIKQAFSSLLLVLLLAHARDARTAATSSTMEDTCKRFAGGDQAGHDYDFCMKTLGADPESASMDAHDLAVDAVYIPMSAARSTGARIARLQLAETVPARRECLNKCAAEYNVTVRRLSDAGSYAYVSGSEHLQKAQRLLAETLGAPLRCDRAFTAAGQRSPLTSTDHELDEAIGLAISIV